MKHLLLLALLLGSSLHAAQRITWKRVQLNDKFYAEGANLADINKDGHQDIVSGPYWYEGPDWQKKHAFYEPKEFSINGYSDNFFVYARDFNGDGWLDLLVLGFPGKEARLYLSPGSFTSDTPWAMSIVADVVDNESPVFTDITGDGKPEIVCSTGGKFGWFAPDWSKPTEKWKFVPISDDMKVAKFTHGLGVGDVNGDGKLDLMEARRWWEQPQGGNLKSQISDPKSWVQHPMAPGIGGGAQMFVYDFDGDGDNDIASTLAAHNFGIAVFENKSGKEGPQWERHMLSGEHPWDSDYGIILSQPHAMHLADINGDGIMDLVTGKRYWAHNGHGPDEHTPLALYWFETRRANGKAEFIPHLIDEQQGVGVGTDVQVGDVNGDKLPDIIVGNKAGVFVMLQERTEISAETAAQLEPKKMYGPGLKPQTDYAHGQSAQDALKGLQLPGGFKADLIAGEPDIVQPIAMCWDERGRLWVVEGMSYPQPRAPGAGKDRIIILEDKDGDGSFETRKVFCEGISLASGIEVGFGGVWVGAAPYFMFIPKGDNDLPLADGQTNPQSAIRNPQFSKVPGLPFTAYALLDGFGSQDTHETLNSFIWGPDGWLYGCHGVFTHSLVGKPGTPDEQRVPLNAGVWRYHPVRHVFEVFAHGTSNPWGLDYDQNGEFFVTACVIPHLYHIVPGARYHRQGGQHFNPYTYEDIETIADHSHYAGNIKDNAHWAGRDAGAIVADDTNEAGGGHAHCGLAIYQSSLFPQTYRNALIFGNLHGHRIVSDYLEPKGSTYTGKHGSDFMRSNDMNFIPVTQKVGPDGALYISDWSDKQVCHRGSNAVELWDRSNGRIYRVSYAGWKPWKGDLSKESDESLAKLAVQTDNEWLSRMARRVLMERSDELLPAVIAANKSALEDGDSLKAPQNSKAQDVQLAASLLLRQSTQSTPSTRATLRSMWVLNSIGAYRPNKQGPKSMIGELLDLASYDWPLTNDLSQLVSNLADEAEAAPVSIWRRKLASLLQRIPTDQRTPIATALLNHGEDKDDPYIPLLIWYGIEPVVGADAKLGLELAKVSKMPKVTEFIYRRMGAEEAGRSGLLTLAAESKDAAQRDALLSTVIMAARAGNKIAMPSDWAALRAKVVASFSSSDKASPNAANAGLKPITTLTELEAYMGVAEAVAAFRQNLGTRTLPAVERELALSVLVQVRDAMTAKSLQEILVVHGTPASLRRKAIQALALLPDPETPGVLISKFEVFTPVEQADAVNTLATSTAGAKALLTAVKAKTIATTLLSPFLARQIATLNNPEVDALLKDTFGDLNAPKADLPQRKDKFRAILTPAVLAKADATKGHVIFSGICGQCHKLFGEGQNVGPDLTGSNRANLDYLLDNVLDPNAVIGKDYQLNIFELNDGRVASGVIKEQTTAAFRVALPGGLEQTITAAEVKKHTVAKVSTMPEGLFEAIPQEQLIQLVAYLQSNTAKADTGKGKAAVKVEGAIEGETLKVLAVKGGNAKLQGMAGFGGRWSNGQQLWWTAAKPGSTLTLALPVAEKGIYQLKGVLTMARDYGIADVSLDGKPVATDFDGYNADKVILTDELDWGTHELDKGEHKLEFTIKGANPSAVKSYMVGLDYVKLEKK